MELKDGKLLVNEQEYKLVKKWNMMASPYVAGLYLYHDLKNKGIIMKWDQYYFRDIILAYRKKNVEIIEEEK